MRVTNETTAWRDIVNEAPEELEAYNANSLTDYIDTVKLYYSELINQVDPNDLETQLQHILIELAELMNAQTELYGEMGDIRVQGNGIYLPNNSKEFKFFDGSPGIAGEYMGFSVSKLPIYQDLLYQQDSKYFTQPTLCLELSEFREYSDSGLQLEASGDSVSVPIEGQDLCFTRGASF